MNTTCAGQTGAGKTYTMEGDAHHPGVTLRAVKQLFATAATKASMRGVDAHAAGSSYSGDGGYRFSISMMEVYQDRVRDLLVNVGQQDIAAPFSPVAASEYNHHYHHHDSNTGRRGSVGGGTVATGQQQMQPEDPVRAYARETARIGVGRSDLKWASGLRKDDSGDEYLPGDNLTVRETKDGVEVMDLTRLHISTVDETLDAISRGSANRHVGAHALNDRSSRSHMIVRIWIDGPAPLNPATDASGGTGSRRGSLGYDRRVMSVLHFVDLSGSERVLRTGAEGERLKEATHINSSLSALGQCIAALRKKQAHIPFRDSKLTFVLKDSMTGNAKIHLFACVSGQRGDVSETIQTLNFATRCRATALGPAQRNVVMKKVDGQISRVTGAASSGDDAAAPASPTLTSARSAVGRTVVTTGTAARAEYNSDSFSPASRSSELSLQHSARDSGRARASDGHDSQRSANSADVEASFSIPRPRPASSSSIPAPASSSSSSRGRDADVGATRGGRAARASASAAPASRSRSVTGAVERGRDGSAAARSSSSSSASLRGMSSPTAHLLMGMMPSSRFRLQQQPSSSSSASAATLNSNSASTPRNKKTNSHQRSMSASRAGDVHSFRTTEFTKHELEREKNKRLPMPVAALRAQEARRAGGGALSSAQYVGDAADGDSEMLASIPGARARNSAAATPGQAHAPSAARTPSVSVAATSASQLQRYGAELDALLRRSPDQQQHQPADASSASEEARSGRGSGSTSGSGNKPKTVSVAYHPSPSPPQPQQRQHHKDQERTRLSQDRAADRYNDDDGGDEIEQEPDASGEDADVDADGEFDTEAHGYYSAHHRDERSALRRNARRAGNDDDDDDDDEGNRLISQDDEQYDVPAAVDADDGLHGDGYDGKQAGDDDDDVGGGGGGWDAVITSSAAESAEEEGSTTQPGPAGHVSNSGDDDDEDDGDAVPVRAHHSMSTRLPSTPTSAANSIYASGTFSGGMGISMMSASASSMSASRVLGASASDAGLALTSQRAAAGGVRSHTNTGPSSSAAIARRILQAKDEDREQGDGNDTHTDDLELRTTMGGAALTSALASMQESPPIGGSNRRPLPRRPDSR